MGLFNHEKKGGLSDVIRCDEEEYLIWKWHPSGTTAGNNRRENEIRAGSSLRVKDGSVAVFVYKQKDGSMQDFIEGPFDETIKTKNFPILSGILGLAYDGSSPFQAEVYFINLAGIIQSKFGVPFFDVFDPRFQDFAVPVSVRGTITFKITDYRSFIKLHRLDDFRMEDFQKQIRDAVNRYVKKAVVNAPSDAGIPVVQLERKTDEINGLIETDLKDRLFQDFGVTVSGVDVSSIEIDKESEGYLQLKGVTLDMSAATVKAQTEANIRNIEGMQKINLENTAETLRIQREESQYAQHLQSQSQNLGAFQVGKQAEVGVAGANALGQMGANGAGSVDTGGSVGGFNPAAFMSSLAVGGVVAQNVAGTMTNTMNQAGIGMPPPPVQAAYHVAVNGQTCGPYDTGALAQMVQSGQLSPATMVWKQGMPAWAPISSIPELSALFGAVPPPIPPQ